MVRISRIHIIPLAFIALFATNVCAQDYDPPSRVFRLSYVNGNVSMEPAGIDDWAPAVVNRPFAIGDYLYTDQSSVAELHTDVAVMRVGQYTDFGVLNLTDTAVQLKLTEGDFWVRLHNFDATQSFEVDTPTAAIVLLREGVYRLHVDPNGAMTYVIVRSGQAEVTGGGQAFTLDPGSIATLQGTDQLSYDVEAAPGPDAFGQWCGQRDARYAHLVSARYLPPTVIGYEDLDDYGAWQEGGEYGAVWYPHDVAADWAPYHDGHWAWVDPWGWTWVDSRPWGFAPFHYGRWVYVNSRWGWAPGPLVSVGYNRPVVHPCYAPALVAWFGGAHWGVSVSIGGGGPSVGWVPLGWGEVYTPTYHVSQNYFRTVNVYNTTIVRNVNITNVYNTVYVNKTVYNQTFVNVRAPNAVVAMPQNSFASGRPVKQAAMVVPAAQVAHIQAAQAAVIAPAIAPTRQALAPTIGRPAPRPPAQLAQRQVIARAQPPAPPPSFAARQTYLQQHAGQPLNYAAVQKAVAPQAQPRPQVALVAKNIPQHPAAVQPGAHVGNVKPAVPVTNNRPGGPVPQNAQRPENPAAKVPVPARAQNEPAPTHGTPPNRAGSPGNPAIAQHPGSGAPQQAVPAARPNAPTPAERPGARPAPETRPAAPEPRPATPAARPAPAEPRSAPAPRPAPENRPAPAARPEVRPTPESRPAPAAKPEAHPTPENRPAPATRPAPAARPAPENKPAAAPHSSPPAHPAPQHPQEKNTKNKDNTKTEH